jgi:hypothetical protein
MNEVRRVVRKASWRLLLIDFFRTLSVTVTVGLAAVLITRLVERAFGLMDTIGPWWPEIFAGAGGAALLGAVAWSVIRRRRSLGVARELDERAGLRETLSTAMCVETSSDPWSAAVVETAIERARKVDVGRAIPIEAPAAWPVPLGTGAALLLVWMTVPNFDLLKITEKKVAEERKAQEVVAVKAEVQSNQDKLKEMLAKAKVEFTDDVANNLADEQKPDGNDPESIRRAAVKQLTSLTERLEIQKEGDKSAQIEAIKEAMRQLKQPGPGPMDEFTRSLARGDFNKAQEKLDELSKAMADSSMSPEDKEAAKKQMENLAKQLEKLSDAQQEVAKKLEQAGLDKKTAQELAKAAAQNPDALKKAIEEMEKLSEDQKKQMMEMAKAAMESAGKCENMSEAMSKMAEGMMQEGLQQEGMEGMEQMAAELSEMEMLQSDMDSLDAALDEAKTQLAKLGSCLGGKEGEGECEGEGMGSWREGSSRNRGNGSGGPGKGNGASPDAEPTDFTIEKKKADGKTGTGPIIGSRLVQGSQVKGESRAEFAEAVEASEKEAAEALVNMQVPKEYEDAVKTYFGTLKAKVNKDAPPAPAPAAEEPADGK